MTPKRRQELDGTVPLHRARPTVQIEALWDQTLRCGRNGVPDPSVAMSMNPETSIATDIARRADVGPREQEDLTAAAADTLMNTARCVGLVDYATIAVAHVSRSHNPCTYAAIAGEG